MKEICLKIIIITAIFSSTSLLSLAAQQSNDPSNDWLVQFRETKTDGQQPSGYVLTIDRSDQATVQKLPLEAGGKVLHTRLTCEEQSQLPDVLKRELPPLRSTYGTGNATKQGETALVSRWNAPEKRVVWRNPPSQPEPPGGWYAVVSYLEEIARRAQKPEQSLPQKNSISYWRSSSGFVGTYVYTLTIDSNGNAVLTGGLNGVGKAGRTQLTGDELTALLQTFQEAKFVDFKQCYGRNAVVNPHNQGIDYAWNGKHNEVEWMSAPADPKPPEGWSKIVAILDKIWERAEKQ